MSETYSHITGEDCQLLPFVQPQPVPLLTRVVHLRVDDRTVTSIFRQWGPGHSGPDGRCRLCPACDAYGDGCLIAFGKYIAREDAPLASRVGTLSQDQAATLTTVQEA